MRILSVLVVVFLVIQLSVPLKDQSKWKISSLNGFIAIYDPSGSLFELTNINVISLPIKEQVDLQIGIEVKDLYELEQIIDGLSQ